MVDSITCICCPLGCRVSVEKKGKEIKLHGQQCKRGEDYAIQEITNPQRVVTTTVFVESGKQKMLPVRSKKEIPKKLVKESVNELSKIMVKAPVKCGDVVCKNILETGVDIIASCNMEREEK